MNQYLVAWKRAFDFEGRSPRDAFWLFILIHLFITVLFIVIDITAQMHWFDTSYGILSFIPFLAAIVRRLHDTGKSGYWGLVFLIPAVGPFWLTYLLAKPSTDHRNLEVAL